MIMTPEEQRKFIEDIGHFICNEIERRIAPLKARIAELELTGIKFYGTYQRALQYSRGDVCNYDSSMWVAVCETPPMEVPGKSTCWQLSVKSPRHPSHRERPLPT
jgi:hypothetical protein